MHHVVPCREGGGNAADNLVTLCGVCHRRWNRAEKNKVGLNFFDWLAGGARRKRALHRSSLLREMTVLRFQGGSFRAIADSLNRRALLTLSGRTWTMDNARHWLQRNCGFDCSRRQWRLVKWPYFIEPVLDRVWRWHRLDRPLGICFQGRRRFFTMRYDFVHLVNRMKEPVLEPLLTDRAGVLIHRTFGSLRGSQRLSLDVPEEFGVPKTLLLRQESVVRRACRKGPGQYVFVGRRWTIPAGWGEKVKWSWQDRSSVDHLFVKMCRVDPSWLYS